MGMLAGPSQRPNMGPAHIRVAWSGKTRGA
jgi:hypothetical protein